MEERGIVSESQGSKPRKVLISKEEWEEMNEQGEMYFTEDSDEEEEYDEAAGE
jgi:PHD/YefM family antitoxin component YafN of YafNO toxin-antitoxin module